MPQAISTDSLLLQGAPAPNPCGDANAGGTKVYLVPAPDCRAPLAYDIATAAIAANATSAALSITPPAGYPALTAVPFHIDAGTVITFRTTAGVLVKRVTVTEAIDINTAPATVQITATPGAVGATDVALLYNRFLLLGATGVNQQGNDSTVDTTKLANGIQGSMDITKRIVQVSVDGLVNSADKGLWRALYPYSTEKANPLFTYVFCNPGWNSVVGMANYSSFSINSQQGEKIRITAQGNFIAPYNQFPIRSEVSPATDLAIHDAYAEYVGLDLATFA
jgi:hypothetical protein